MAPSDLAVIGCERANGSCSNRTGLAVFLLMTDRALHENIGFKIFGMFFAIFH